MSDAQQELRSLASDLRGHLEWLRDSGERFMPSVPASPRVAAVSEGLGSALEAPEADFSLKAAMRAALGARAPTSASIPAPPVARAPASAPASLAAQASASVPTSPTARVSASVPVPAAAPADLAALRDQIGDCYRCKLGPTRRKLVFGEGAAHARLVFVGEAPGEEEDLQGRPFVGKAGQLLTKMIEAMGFRREEVYICNVCKCRPPGNRNPEPDEVAACEGFLQAQIKLIQPEVIVSLGKTSAHALLRETAPISRLRGTFKSYCGIPLMPTFHPAYLLRDPTQKRYAWEDLQQAMALLNKGAAPR